MARHRPPSIVDQRSRRRLNRTELHTRSSHWLFGVLAVLIFVSVDCVAVPDAWPLSGELLPVPNTQSEGEPTGFTPAPPEHVLHMSILFGGWVKAGDFSAAERWLTDQGFTITRTIEPEPWRTYPSLSFTATVAQVNAAFRVKVMRKRGCFATFTNFLMPASFAQGHEKYIEGFNFSGLNECR